MIFWLAFLIAQHTTTPSRSPDDRSEHEECREKAHRDHCECWLRCNSIPDESLRDHCKDSCSETEKLEMNKCNAS